MLNDNINVKCGREATHILLARYISVGNYHYFS